MSELNRALFQTRSHTFTFLFRGHVALPKLFLSSDGQEGECYCATSVDIRQDSFERPRAEFKQQNIACDQPNAQFRGPETREADAKFVGRRQHQKRMKHKCTEYAQHQKQIEE